jgi:ABC-type nitrate/sulfonate/bicarbonate transport system permease component
VLRADLVAVWRGVLRRVFPFLVVLLIWELLVQLGPLQNRMFPSLGAIGSSVATVWVRGEYQPHTAATAGRVLTGLAAALVAGIALGFLMARIRAVELMVEPLFSATYAVPRLTLYPILILAFGTGELTRFVLIFAECLYPITISAFHGAQAVRQSLVWAARSMGTSGPMLFWRVVAPASLPSIFSGVRIAAPVGMIVGVVVEMIGANTGLGYLVMVAAASFRPAEIFAYALAIALAGFLLDRLIVAAQRRVVVWA